MKITVRNKYGSILGKSVVYMIAFHVAGEKINTTASSSVLKFKMAANH